MVNLEDVRLLTLGAVAGVTGFVALLVLAGDPRRNWNQWLAFFLLLVSGNFAMQALHGTIAFAAMEGRLDPGRAASLGRAVSSAGYAFLAFDPAALAYFASIFPRRTALAQRPWGLPLLAAPALGFLGLELAAHRLSAPPGPFDPVRFAFFAYLAACYLYAAWRLLSNYVHDPSSVMARQSRVVAIGILIAALPRVALLADDLAVDLAPLWGPPVTLISAVNTLLVTMISRVAILWILFVLVWSWLRRQPLSETRRAEAAAAMRLVAVAFLVFTVIWMVSKGGSLVEYLGFAAAGQPLEGVGALSTVQLAYVSELLTYSIRWYAFSLAMLAGIVRYQVLSVDPRAIGLACVAAAAAGAFAVVGLTAGALSPWLVAAIAAGFLLVSVAVVYLLFVRHPLAARSRAYLHERSLEVYRAMIAANLAEGPLSSPKRAELDRGRARLGISRREHETLLAVGRAEQGGARQETLLGRFEVVRRLGAGGYATVHLCRDREGGGLVVLKRIRSEWAGGRGALEAALRELEVARRVSHPNVIAVHDMVRLDDGAVLVMEYAEGGSLREFLEERRAVPPAECAAVLRGALAALAAVHEAGIAHGDLKPENILLAADGTVKLADFGTACAVAGAQTLVRGTAGRDAPGTLLYMAPEQLRGKAAAAHSALGAVAYEMLAGRSYVDAAGKSAYEVMERVVHGPPRALTGLPPGWERFLAGALAPRAEERYRSAAEMVGALDLAVAKAGPPSRGTGRLQSRGRWWARV